MQTTARASLSSLGDSTLLRDAAYVGGDWLGTGAGTSVRDPATGERIASVAQCPVEVVGTAVAEAQAVFDDWRGLLPRERGALLARWSALIRRNAEDLATILTCEQGKPLAEARGEITYAAEFIDWFAAEGERAYGETLPSHKRDSQIFVRVKPVGVVAAITPWNFPCAMITRKAAAALAAGCPVIVKPANETPLSALALARLAEQAGLPGGVFQVLTGEPGPLTEALIASPPVRALSFTGSTRVGRLLSGQAAASVKRVSMELGGHAPFIVFDDAKLDSVVPGALAAKFATSGQDCLAANRIYVQRSLYRDFVEAFAAEVSRLKVGHGLDPATQIGPMTHAGIAQNCRRQIADAVAGGARVVVGERGGANDGSNFVAPTLLADVADGMLISREETFGPVAAILPFDSEDEVVARANASEMGLAAYVYTDDLRRGMRMSDRLEYGMVGVNTPSFTGAPIPFGGWKQSGLGREGSRHGLSAFTELKYVCLGDLAA